MSNSIDRNDSEPTALPGNFDAKMMILLLVGYEFLWVLFLFYLPLSSLTVLFIYATPMSLVVALFFALRFKSAGTSSKLMGVELAGMAFIVGGLAFDIVATVIHTPTLENEANLISRSLLDSGHSVEFVYGYGAVAFSLYIACVCVMWISLVRHRTTLAESEKNNLTFLLFIKAITGCSHLTWRQWFFPYSIKEFPRAYHFYCSLCVGLSIAMIDHWFAGLLWFRLLPYQIRWYVIGVSMLFGFTVYVLMLWNYAKKLHREQFS